MYHSTAATLCHPDRSSQAFSCVRFSNAGLRSGGNSESPIPHLARSYRRHCAFVCSTPATHSLFALLPPALLCVLRVLCVKNHFHPFHDLKTHARPRHDVWHLRRRRRLRPRQNLRRPSKPENQTRRPRKTKFPPG